MFIIFVPQPAVSPRKHANDIFIGDPQAALMVINQPLVVASMAPACDKCGNGIWERKGHTHFFVQ
jgi:hypothetical protein